MKLKGLLLILLSLFFLQSGNTQLITSDTTAYSDNIKDYTLIKHNGTFPIWNQFPIGDELFFCGKTGLFQQTPFGIELIEEPINNSYPILLVEDENALNGYQTVYATFQGVNTIILGGEISNNFNNINSSEEMFSFINEHVPNKHEIAPFFYLYDYSAYSNPEYNSVITAASFRQDEFSFQMSVSTYGYQPSYFYTMITTPNGVFEPTESEKEEIENHQTSDPCIVKDELYFTNGKVVKITDNHSKLKHVVNDFSVSDIGNWNDELVMMGNGMLTIGFFNNRVDISDVLTRIGNIFGSAPTSMKIDCNNHLWFSSTNNEAIVELILEDELLTSFVETNNNLYFDRFEVSSDTSDISEQGENLKVVNHKVFDVVGNKVFSPNHVIDAGGDVFVSSDFGYLRRQSEGLVPVVEPNFNEEAYYLLESDDSQNQLFPFKYLNTARNPDGYHLIEYINEEADQEYFGNNMLNKLLEEGDGRDFYLKDYKEVNTVASLGSVYSLFGWGKTDGDYLIEKKEDRTWLESGCVNGEYNHEVTFFQANSSLNYLNTIGYDACTGTGMEEFGGEPRDFKDLEYINDTLTLFPCNSFFYNSTPFSLHADGQTYDYNNSYEFFPISVDQYKDEPIYLSQPDLSLELYLLIGHNENAFIVKLFDINIQDVTDVRVTNDNHIWLLGENLCYEIIREQDQGINQDLKTFTEIYNVEIELLSSCTDTTDAVIEVNFLDSQLGESNYNVYLDRELFVQVSDTQTVEIPLIVENGIEQTFEIFIQNQADPLVKKSQVISLQCIVDLDGDGFTIDVDCDDTNASINPDAEDIPNNEIDEDCDGEIFVIDNDNDGFNSDEDCNDEDPSINPNAEDVPNNGIDEDCDGSDLTSVYEIDGLKISIFPNPVVNKLNVQLSDNTDFQFRVMTIDGKILLSGNFDSVLNKQIDLSAIPTGLYYLELQNHKTSIVERIVVAK